jgi:hypothetical protein
MDCNNQRQLAPDSGIRRNCNACEKLEVEECEFADNDGGDGVLCDDCYDDCIPDRDHWLMINS